MRIQRRNIQNIMFKTVLFSVSALCLFLGLALCLVKSPQEKSQQFLAMASQYDDRIINELTENSQKFLLTEKQNLIHRAIQYDPNNHQTWIDLSYTFLQLKDVKSSVEAMNVVKILNPGINISAEDLMALLPEDNAHENKMARAVSQFQLSFTY